MKRLFEKLFKKEPQFNYIIAEYQPNRSNSPMPFVNIAELDIEEPAFSDEMEIDKIYQNS